MLVRPRDDAALGRHRDVEHVRGCRIARRLDLDPMAQRAAAQDPAALRDLRAHAGDERLPEADEPAADMHDDRRGAAAARSPARRRTRRSRGRRRSRAPRPTTRSAGSRCPSCAPRRRSRRRATSRRSKPSARARRTSGRQYWRMNGSQPAGPGAVPRPRPLDDVVEPGIDAVELHMAGVAGEGGADPHAVRVLHGPVEDRRMPTARLGGDAGQRPARADAAEHDRGPPVGPREPPEPAAERRAQLAEAFALASSQARTKPSRSPSSTRSALPTSKSVRWSLTIVYGCRT